MKAEEVAAGKLFDSGQQLLVPIWQRRYTWDKQDWLELWKDLEHLQAAPNASHFIGSIVLKALPWRGLPSEAKRYWIVDGQQRAITLTLLAAAIRDRLARLSGSDEDRVEVSRAYTDQLFRNASLKEGHQERLVLQAQDASRLSPIVDGLAGVDLSDAPIDRAYDFFAQAVRDLTASELEGLLSTALVRMMAVWVVLEEGDNAHRVFQTLNAGGKALRQADLVRNYFFLLLGDAGDEFYNAHWQLLEADLPARELEEYFVAWTITQGHTGGKQSLFRYFQEDLSSAEEDESAVLNYGRMLTRTARQFQWIRSPEDSPLESAKDLLFELNAWGTVPAEGLILLLLRQFTEEKLDDASLAEALELVLSFMARRMLAGYEPQLHKDIFVRAAHRLRARKDLEGRDLVTFLRYTLSRGADVRSWPTTDLVVSRVTSNALYTAPRSHWVKCILQRAARTLREPQDPAPASQDLHVGHVMPESLTPQWVEDLSNWGVEHPAGLHELRVQVLGNLTLIEGDSPLLQATFDQEKAALAASGLTINRMICSESSWTGHEIDARSIELAKRVCQTYVEPMDREALRTSRFADAAADSVLSETTDSDEDV
jgi:hypothetical protein